MKNLALGALIVGLMACGGGSGTTDVMIIDGSVDSPGATVCSPLTQMGCNANEMCTWINDQDNPPIGHVGCAPMGTVAIGGACTTGTAGPMGYDNCAKGGVCLGGECKQICDQQGGAPMCDANHSCTQYADFFDVGGVAVAGVCDPSCDPLTQDLKVGTALTACGSPSPALPTKGCYGNDVFSCAPSGYSPSSPTSSANLDLTDRTTPRGPAGGGVYLNGCAPGYLPFFFEMEGSMKTLCSGYCAALEIDMTAAHVGNKLGSTTALAKLPKGAAPAAGNGTCSSIKKGSVSGGPEMCVFMYPLIADRTTGAIAPTFDPYIDTLGACFAYTQFTYDNDANAATPNVPNPDCSTLPPRSAATPGDFDDAADWGCQKLANSMFTGKTKGPLAPALNNVHIVKNSRLVLTRHAIN
jgi:hypothetical protein